MLLERRCLKLAGPFFLGRKEDCSMEVGSLGLSIVVRGGLAGG